MGIFPSRIFNKNDLTALQQILWMTVDTFRLGILLFGSWFFVAIIVSDYPNWLTIVIYLLLLIVVMSVQVLFYGIRFNRTRLHKLRNYRFWLRSLSDAFDLTLISFLFGFSTALLIKGLI